MADKTKKVSSNSGSKDEKIKEGGAKEKRKSVSTTPKSDRKAEKDKEDKDPLMDSRGDKDKDSARDKPSSKKDSAREKTSSSSKREKEKPVSPKSPAEERLATPQTNIKEESTETFKEPKKDKKEKSGNGGSEVRGKEGEKKGSQVRGKEGEKKGSEVKKKTTTTSDDKESEKKKSEIRGDRKSKKEPSEDKDPFDDRVIEAGIRELEWDDFDEDADLALLEAQTEAALLLFEARSILQRMVNWNCIKTQQTLKNRRGKPKALFSVPDIQNVLKMSPDDEDMDWVTGKTTLRLYMFFF